MDIHSKFKRMFKTFTIIVDNLFSKIDDLAGVLGKVTLQVNVLRWMTGVACVVAIVAVLIAILK